MIRSHRRATVAASAGAAALLLSTTLSGCGAGFDAATTQPYNPTNGTMGQVGNITLQNVIVVQTSALPDAPLDVQAGIVNVGNGTDVLTDAKVGTQTVKLADGVIPIPVRTNVAIGRDPNLATVTGVGATAGQLVTVTFTFRDAGVVSLTTSVLTQLNVITGS